ncbi:MAG: hypothetical protein ACFFCS_22700 [Candidatus Hodarchaeota archaeon]
MPRCRYCGVVISNKEKTMYKGSCLNCKTDRRVKEPEDKNFSNLDIPPVNKILGMLFLFISSVFPFFAMFVIPSLFLDISESMLMVLFYVSLPFVVLTLITLTGSIYLYKGIKIKKARKMVYWGSGLISGYLVYPLTPYFIMMGCIDAGIALVGNILLRTKKISINEPFLCPECALDISSELQSREKTVDYVPRFKCNCGAELKLAKRGNKYYLHDELVKILNEERRRREELSS